MANVKKKKKKLEEKIFELEQELKESLTKKTSNTKEINVPEYISKIATLNKELAKL